MSQLKLISDYIVARGNRPGKFQEILELFKACVTVQDLKTLNDYIVGRENKKDYHKELLQILEAGIRLENFMTVL